MKTIITIILITISQLVSAQNILNKYLETAAKESPVLKAKFNEYLASMEKIPQVSALPDPQLIFGYFIMPVETKNGSQQAKVSLTQMFPWFGTLNAKENVAVNAAKARYEVFENEKSKLFFEVKSTFYDIYFIRKKIEITQENIKILNTLKRLALIKIEAGKASATDELKIEMQLADLQNDFKLFNDDINVNELKFSNLLNSNISKINTPDSLWDDDFLYEKQAILDSLKINNHGLKKLDFVSETYKSKEIVSKKQSYPNIVAGIDYIGIANNSISPESGRDALFVKVGFSIPLHRKKYKAAINEAVIMQKATDDLKTAKINSLETIFDNYYSKYEDAKRKIILFEKQKVLAERTIKLLETEYSVTGANFEEILRIQRMFLRYSLELEKAKVNKLKAVAFINFLMGK